jgi:hypothetical protein
MKGIASMRYQRFMFIIIAALVALAFPALALADTTAPNGHLVLPTDQIWAFVAGNLAPLLMYLVNRYMPYTSETIKALMQGVGAAVAGGIAQAITAGGVGFNSATLQFVVTAVIGMLIAHHWVWKATPVAAALRGDGSPV